MIEELRVAVELVARCPEEVQRIAAAALFVHASQVEIRCRVSAQMEELARQSSTDLSRETTRARVLAKAS